MAKARARLLLASKKPGNWEAALNAISKRDDVDPMRFGLWGTNLGAYASLFTAEHDPRVRSMVIESVYDRPEDFLASTDRAIRPGAAAVGRTAYGCGI